MTTTTESIVSIGKLADEWDCHRDDVKAAAKRAGVRPSHEIDSALFYRKADKPAIHEHLGRRESNR